MAARNACMILHRVDARDVNGDGRVGRNPSPLALGRTESRIRVEFFRVDAVIDDDHVPRPIAPGTVKGSTALRIGDHEIGPGRQPRAPAQDRAVSLVVHVRCPEIPQERARPSPAGQAVGERRHDVAVIHPAVDHLRRQSVDEAGEAGEGTWHLGEGGDAEGGDADPALLEDVGVSSAIAEAHHVLRHAAGMGGRGELHEHRLRAAGAKPRDDVQNRDGHVEFPATKASWVKSAASL